MENIVAEHEADAVVADKLAADDESLGEAVGRGLLGIAEVDSIVGSVAEQAAEAGKIGRSGDDQYVADSGEHEHGNRIVDHRFVVDRKQLLADSFGDGI